MVTATAGQLRTLCSDNLKGVADKLQLLRHSTASALSSPPLAGQVVSSGYSVRVPGGSEAGSGLRAEDWRNGSGSTGSCCSPSTFTISSRRALMRSSSSRTWRSVFSCNFSELLPNCMLNDQRLQAVDFDGVRSHPL